MPWSFFAEYAETFLTAGFFISGLLALGLIFVLERMNKLELPEIGRLCRNNLLSIPLSAIAFFWVTPHIPVLLAGVSLETIYLLVLGGFIASCIWLDYLYARAVAGLMILWVYSSNNLGFAFHTPCFQGFVVLNIILAVFALWVAARPYALRDFLFGFGHRFQTPLRWIVRGYLTVYGLYALALGILQIYGVRA